MAHHHTHVRSQTAPNEPHIHPCQIYYPQKPNQFTDWPFHKFPVTDFQWGIISGAKRFLVIRKLLFPVKQTHCVRKVFASGY